MGIYQRKKWNNPKIISWNAWQTQEQKVNWKCTNWSATYCSTQGRNGAEKRDAQKNGLPETQTMKILKENTTRFTDIVSGALQMMGL